MQTIRGKISQEGAGAPVVVLFDEEIISFGDCEYLQTGQYKAVCNRAVLNSDMPPKWFTADSSGSRYAVAAVNQTDVIIQCFTRHGDPVNGILSGAEFELQTK